ncbi:hypothetical protein N9846_03150 [Akkermansiaceae bacterium]|nr:hypothetical protein [Akkermansiaceae bacterium]
MKTLREGERRKDEEGEVVTRDDGSVARKVRKRRRRSEQTKNSAPEKEKKSLVLKASLFVGAFLLLLMVGVFTVAAFNSGSYTGKVEARASEWTGAEVKIAGLRMMPGNISATKADFRWDESYYLDHLELKTISGDAKVTTFTGAKLGGQQVGGNAGSLSVRVPNGTRELGEPISVGDFPFDFHRYFCNSLDVTFGENDDLVVIRAETSLRHINGEGFRLTAGGGQLALKGWDRFPIENALLKFSPGEVDLVSLRLLSPPSKNQTTNAVLSLSGKIPLELGAEAQLDVTTEGFPFDVLMGNSLGSFFPGMIRRFEKEGVEMGVVNFKVGDAGLKNIILPFDGNFLEMKRFGFLSDIEQLFVNSGKGAFFFDSNIKGTYRWTPEGSGIEDLSAKNDNFQVSGNVIVTSKGELRGRLTLLISLGLIKGDDKLKHLPGFRNTAEGYAKVTINLGGTVSQPKDDFKQVTGIQLTPADKPQEKMPGFDDFFNDKFFEETTTPDDE